MGKGKEYNQPKETNTQESILIVFIPQEQYQLSLYPQTTVRETFGRKQLIWNIHYVGLTPDLTMSTDEDSDALSDPNSLNDGILYDELLNFLKPEGKQFSSADSILRDLYADIETETLYDLHIQLSALACKKVIALNDKQPSPKFNGDAAKILEQTIASVQKSISGKKRKRPDY